MSEWSTDGGLHAAVSVPEFGRLLDACTQDAERAHEGAQADARYGGGLVAYGREAVRVGREPFLAATRPRRPVAASPTYFGSCKWVRYTRNRVVRDTARVAHSAGSTERGTVCQTTHTKP